MGLRDFATFAAGSQRCLAGDSQGFAMLRFMLNFNVVDFVDVNIHKRVVSIESLLTRKRSLLPPTPSLCIKSPLNAIHRSLSSLIE